jgi:hypothetical protein
MGVEQHLVGLLRVGPEEEGAAAGQFEVSDLQLGPLAGNDRPMSLSRKRPCRFFENVE